jgi:hypothetical protein
MDGPCNAQLKGKPLLHLAVIGRDLAMLTDVQLTCERLFGKHAALAIIQRHCRSSINQCKER